MAVDKTTRDDRAVEEYVSQARRIIDSADKYSVAGWWLLYGEGRKLVSLIEYLENTE